MRSYAKRIFHLMKEKYYARYSEDGLKVFTPEGLSRVKYTIPKECVMLPIPRNRRDKGENIEQVPHDFLAGTFSEGSGKLSNENVPDEDENVLTPGTEPDETIPDKYDLLVVDSPESEPREKIPTKKRKRLPRSVHGGKQFQGDVLEGKPLSKKAKKIPPSIDELLASLKERFSEAEKIREELRIAKEEIKTMGKLREELRVARKEMKTMGSNYNNATFVMNAHSDRMYTEFCIWYDTVWTSLFHKLKPSTEEGLEGFFQRYLSHKPPHYFLSGIDPLTTLPEITMDKGTPPLATCIKNLDKAKNELGTELLDLSRVYIEPKRRDSTVRDRIMDMMMLPHKYLRTSDIVIDSSHGIVPALGDSSEKVKEAISRYTSLQAKSKDPTD